MTEYASFEVCPFDWWVMLWFDHDSDRFYDPDDDGDLALTVSQRITYYAQLFENAAELLQPYSNQQLNASLWTMAHDLGVSILDLLPQMAARALVERCCRSIYELYAQVFQPRCDAELGAGARDYPENPLNMIVYMWWDTFAFIGRPEDPLQSQIDPLMLDVMARTLDLESIACQEGALHGLGHWHYRYPQQVEAIIDAYLRRVRGTDIPPALITYAEAARCGCVQ